MLHHGGAGSQSQLQRSATTSQPQLNSPSRPLPQQAHPVDVNNRYVIEPCVEFSIVHRIDEKYYSSNDRHRHSSVITDQISGTG